MKAKWKRNAVVGTMVVLVCAAVALNLFIFLDVL